MSLSAMTVSVGRFAAVLAFGAVLTLAATTAADAQGGDIPKMRHMNREADKAAPAQPDAVPGAKPRGPAAPPTKPAADMSPNEALFDAINRGDIASARDAMNRGAELSATNVLGMTPLELSVDLGRNDISFMLLSMRGEDGGRGSRAVTRQSDTPASKAMAAKPAPSKGPQVAKDIPVATKPVATPKLFANDGGAPVPSAGFLGFDARAATN